MTQDPAQLEALAVALAVEAATMVRRDRPAGLGVEHTKTTELDVVTVMDTRSEALLRERLAAARPQDAILGEEDGISPGTSGLTWVLDPIDGTVNYLYDLPGYAVSVAVVEGDPTVPGAWAPLAGAVATPAAGEVFHAHRGGGARVSRFDPAAGPHTPEVVRTLSVTGADRLGEVLVATGFAYDRAVRAHQARLVADLLPRVRDIRRAGAAAVDLCHVAAGRVDAYFEEGCHVWDVAAGALVVAEAGGVVTGLGPDAPPSEAMTVAGGPAAHALVLKELMSSRSRSGRTTPPR